MSKRKTHIYFVYKILNIDYIDSEASSVGHIDHRCCRTRVYLLHIYHKYRKNCKTLINYQKKLEFYSKNFHLIAGPVSFPLIP